MPKLSVIIPCYNMGAFVIEALNSVLSYPNQEQIEIIVVNDGSNDEGYTRQILDQFTQPNITIIHQVNLGLGAARNNGIKTSNAPYVLMLDADNAVYDCYIDEGIKILDANPQVGLVYSDLHRFGDIEDMVKIGEFNIVKLLYKNYIDACAVVRKSAWLDLNGYDEQMPIMGYEDWDFNLRLFFNGWQLYYCNKVCFKYRIRDNSMLTHSNKHKAMLLDYMFGKPEFKQPKLLRDTIIDYYSIKTELSRLKKRKVISFAIKIEKPLKSFISYFKK